MNRESVNAASQYERVAKKNGVPESLIKAVVRRCKTENWCYAPFEKVAKAADVDFWKAAQTACDSNTGELFDLYWILMEAGSDVDRYHVSEEVKARKESIINAIKTLKRELSRESELARKPKGARLDLMRLLSYSEGKNYSYVFGYSQRERLVQKEQNAYYAWANCDESDSEGQNRARLEHEQAVSDLDKYDESYEHGFDEIEADRIIKIAKSPTVNDLLTCLAVAVEKDYEPQGIEYVEDSRARPRHSDSDKPKVEMQWMMQQVIGWFRDRVDEAPMKLILPVIKSAYEAMSGKSTNYNMTSMYGVSMKSYRKTLS